MASFVYMSLLVPILACQYDLLRYAISDCDPGGLRTASYYWENCTDPVPAPITGLRCDLDCQAGFYLGLNQVDKKSECKECPENTYSEGGAKYLVPGRWGEFEQEFNSRCFVNFGRRISVGESCPWWDSAEDSRYLTTGEGLDDIWYETMLEGNFHLAKKGKFSMRYRKVSAWLHSVHTGVFSVMIRGDNEPFNYTDREQTTGWREVTRVLEPGDYDVEISYRFLFVSEANTRSEIQWLKISGTSLSDLSCLPCQDGFFSHPSASDCYQCPVNNYYDPGRKTCMACGTNMFSPAGSVGASACKQRAKCSMRDYMVGYTNCKAGKRMKTYEWVQPQICDKQGALPLPNDEEVTCELCLPGHFHAQISSDESLCRPCLPGTYTTSISGTTECQTCPAGSYAAKVLNYTVWSPFPEGIENECRTRRGEQCAFNTGWIPSLFTLTTGTLHESEIELILTRYVNIIHKSATVSFSYTLESGSQGGRLEFLINNRITKEYKADTAMMQSGEIPLQLGYQKLTWVYYHPENGSDIAYIHYIAVEGSDEGGADSCLPCPSGHWSEAKSTICHLCPPGQSAAPGSVGCQSCGMDEYSPVAGGLCMKCPPNTESNLSRTACQFSHVLSFNSTIIPIWELSMASKSPSLCTSSQSRLFCKGSFYGPVISPTGNRYYISVLNPEKLELVDHVSVDSLPYGYAYGVLNASAVNFSSPELSSDRYYCIEGEEGVLVNLGGRVEAVGYESGEALQLRYAGGAVCSKTGQTFGSQVSLECNSTARDGWPSVVSESECYVSFHWRTRYACPICRADQVEISISACSNGRRQVTLHESRDCVPVEVIRDSWEDCNEVMEILGKWQTYAALGAILMVSAVTIVLIYCYCNVKSRYVHLVEVKARQTK